MTEHQFSESVEAVPYDHGTMQRAVLRCSCGHKSDHLARINLISAKEYHLRDVVESADTAASKPAEFDS